jgi:hypothetical protein
LSYWRSSDEYETYSNEYDICRFLRDVHSAVAECAYLPMASYQDGKHVASPGSENISRYSVSSVWRRYADLRSVTVQYWTGLKRIIARPALVPSRYGDPS